MPFRTKTAQAEFAHLIFSSISSLTKVRSMPRYLLSFPIVELLIVVFRSFGFMSPTTVFMSVSIATPFFSQQRTGSETAISK